jgi:hypothetical protein
MLRPFDDQDAIGGNVVEAELLDVGWDFDAIKIDVPDRRRQILIGLDDREARAGNLALVPKRG